MSKSLKFRTRATQLQSETTNLDGKIHQVRINSSLFEEHILNISGCRILFLSHLLNTETNLKSLKYMYDTHALQSIDVDPY